MVDRFDDWVIYDKNGNVQPAQIEPDVDVGPVSQNEGAGATGSTDDWLVVVSGGVVASEVEGERANILGLPDGPAAKDRLISLFDDAAIKRNFDHFPKAFEEARKRALAAVQARFGALCPSQNAQNIKYLSIYAKEEINKDPQALTPQTAESFFKNCYERAGLFLAVQAEVAKLKNDPAAMQRLGVDANLVNRVKVRTVCRSPAIVARLASLQTEADVRGLLEEVMTGAFRQELDAKKTFVEKHREFFTKATGQLVKAGVSEADARELVEDLGDGYPSDDEAYRNPQTGLLDRVSALVKASQTKLQGKVDAYLNVMERFDLLMGGIKTGRSVVRDARVLTSCKHPMLISLANVAERNLANDDSLVAALKRYPMDGRELEAALKQFVDGAANALDGVKTSNAQQLLENHAVSIQDLKGSMSLRVQMAKVMVMMHMARHPELVQLLNDHAGEVQETLERIMSAISDKSPTCGWQRGVVCACFVNELLDRVAARSRSAEVADDLRNGLAGPEINKFVQKMHALYGDRVEVNLARSDVWQKVKTSFIERHEAGVNVTEAEVSSAYEEALMKSVVESMAAEAVKNGAAAKNEFELSGFLQSAAVLEHLAKVRKGDDETEFANALANRVTEEIVAQQKAKNSRDSSRDAALQDMAQWLGEPEGTVRSKFAKELHLHLAAQLNEWFATPVEKRVPMADELARLQTEAPRFCREAFLLFEALGDRRTPGKISELQASEEIKQRLRTLLPDLLRRPDVSARLSAATRADARALLYDLLQKEALNLAGLEARVQRLMEWSAVRELAAVSGLSLEAARAAVAKGLDAVMEKAVGPLFVKAQRQDGVVTDEAVQGLVAELDKQVSHYVASRRAALQDIGRSPLPADLKLAACEGILASGGEGTAETFQTMAGEWIARFDDAFLQAYPQMPERVKEGVRAFCRGGFSRESLESAALACAGQTKDKKITVQASARILTEMEFLPKNRDIAAAQAASVIKLAYSEYNAAQIDAFGQGLKVEFVEALGLDQMKAQGVALDEAKRKELEKRLAELQEGDEKLEEVIQDLKEKFPNDKEGRKLSADFWAEVAAEKKRQIASGRVGIEGTMLFRQKVAELREAETDFGMPLFIVLKRRYPQWTDEQRQWMQDTLCFLQKKMPDVRVYSPVMQQLADVISGRHGKVRLPKTNQAIFLKSLALFSGDADVVFGASLVKGNLLQLERAFEAKGRAIGLKDIYKVLFHAAPKPAQDMVGIHQQTHSLFWRLMDRALRLKWPKEKYEAEREKARLSALEVSKTSFQYKDRELSPEEFEDLVITQMQFTSAEMNVMADFQLVYGVSVVAAMKHLRDKCGFTLDSFAMKPFISLREAGSKSHAEAQFQADFRRLRGVEQSNGSTSYDIEQPDGHHVWVDDKAEGFLSPEDAKRCQDGYMNSKVSSVFKALQALCGANELQYRLALQAMSQGGPRSFASLIIGKPGEATKFDYRVSKDANGNILVAVRPNPADDPNQLLATVTITPEGQANYTDFRISNKQTIAMNEAGKIVLMA